MVTILLEQCNMSVLPPGPMGMAMKFEGIMQETDAEGNETGVIMATGINVVIPTTTENAMKYADEIRKKATGQELQVASEQDLKDMGVADLTRKREKDE